MPAAVVKSYAEKLGKSVEEIEKYWKEAKKAAEGEKSKGDDAFYGTVMVIFKNKLRKHAGLSESRTRFAEFINPIKTVNEEKFNDYIEIDDMSLSLIKLFSGKKKIKDHKDIHKLAEDMGYDPEKVEEVAYSMLQSFWSNGRAMEKGMKFEVSDKEVKMGIEVEYEHTDSKVMAYRIALDHLAELPDYYTRLTAMEKEGERSLKGDK